MTQTETQPKIVDKIVVTFDICSSTKILEQLLARNAIQAWSELLYSTEKLLREEKRGELYKFTGDGWIMFFNLESNVSELMSLIKKLSKHYESMFKETIATRIDDPYGFTPGLTFGIDHGELVELTMDGKVEYIGRPINMACRLQGAIDENDFKAGYRVLLSNVTYLKFSNNLDEYCPGRVEKSLRNVFGGSNLTCYRLIALEPPFRIVSARYGAEDDWRDVTTKCVEATKGSQWEIIASNGEFDCHPARGKGKTLEVTYRLDGKEYNKSFKENSLARLL